jgi:hypothetical protein
MKKTVTGVVLVIGITFALKQSGVFDALLLFILVGAIPGSTISLSPSMTLALITFSSAALIAHLTLPALFSLINQYRLAKKKQLVKNRMPKRRFSEI